MWSHQGQDQRTQGALVAKASAGREVVVTDRGKPVARLVPFSTVSDVERGIDEGWIEPARRTGLSAVTRSRSEISTLDVLEDDRG